MSEIISFPYVLQQNTMGERTLRPQLPITLTYRDESIEVTGLVDSGADVNGLPYEIGHTLGAVWDDQLYIVELSGNLARYQARALIIQGRIVNLEPVQLAFAWTQARDAPLLFGQTNFFIEFDVCFYATRGVFEVGNNK